MKRNQRIKPLLTTTILASIFSFTVTSNLLAKDFKSPHKLEAGQTLSADVLNEIIESVAYSEKIPTRDDFLGTWSCRRGIPFHPNSPTIVNSPYTSTIVQEMIHVVAGTLQFSTDGSGNYYATDQTPGILLYQCTPGSTMINQPYATLDSYLFMTYQMYYDCDVDVGGGDPLDKCDTWDYYQDARENMKVVFRGDNQFEVFSFRTLQAGSSITCDKTNIPPEIPEETTVSISGNSVTLTWKDKSEDETGFTVLRRDTLEGQWQKIANVDSATDIGTTVTYTDTGLSAGTYWYRVQAENANGKSLGSNVSKVKIQ